MFKAIVVDDEPIIAEALAECLSHYDVCELLGTYSEPLVALESAKTQKPDCAFLDIEMIGMNGFELAEQLLIVNPNIEIIFVTAYNHYAIQAFEINALDYLLKPVVEERLEQSIERIATKIKGHQFKENLQHKCHIKCFGGFEVYVGDQMIKWNRAKTRELFAYLIQWKGKSLSKYALCEAFWPEQSQEQALSNLQTAIWSIRKKFKDLGFDGIRIEYADHRYFIGIEGISCDMEKFKKQYLNYNKTGEVDERKRAIALYQGEYMEGEDWLWCYADKAKYEKMYEELIRQKD